MGSLRERMHQDPPTDDRPPPETSSPQQPPDDLMRGARTDDPELIVAVRRHQKDPSAIREMIQARCDVNVQSKVCQSSPRPRFL